MVSPASARFKTVSVSRLLSVSLKWMFLHQGMTVTLTQVGPKCCLMLIIGWQRTGRDSFLHLNPPAEASQVGAAEFGDLGWVRHAERLFFFFSVLWCHHPFDLMPVYHGITFPADGTLFRHGHKRNIPASDDGSTQLKVKLLRQQVMIRLVCSELMQSLQFWNVVTWT